MLGKRIGNINLMETTLCFVGTTDLKKRVCSTSVLYSKELAIPVSQKPEVTFVLVFRYKVCKMKVGKKFPGTSGYHLRGITVINRPMKQSSSKIRLFMNRLESFKLSNLTSMKQMRQEEDPNFRTSINVMWLLCVFLNGDEQEEIKQHSHYH